METNTTEKQIEITYETSLFKFSVSFYRFSESGLEALFEMIVTVKDDSITWHCGIAFSME